MRAPGYLQTAGGFLLAAGLWGVSVVFSRGPSLSFPLFERPVMEIFATQDMAMVLNGARRLGADLAFIQLLQYYGTPANMDPNHPRGRRRAPPPPQMGSHANETEEVHAHHHGGSELSGAPGDRPSGSFPQLLEYAVRVGSLDPRFHFAFLLTSGALAFNLNRNDEAIKVLDAGLRGDPDFWRYRLYQGAIAYQMGKEMDKTISRLEEAILDPDCPSMVKNILANIHRKQGNPKRAAEIYLDLFENSRDRSYADFALERLREMGLVPTP